jgi:hypothetical protein
MLREVEYDPFTKETKKWYFDGDKIVHERSADLSTMISACKETANITSGFSSRYVYHKVASIPPIVQHKILKEHNLDVFTDDPVERKKVERIIELEYPVLKTNSSKLWRPT